VWCILQYISLGVIPDIVPTAFYIVLYGTYYEPILSLKIIIYIVETCSWLSPTDKVVFRLDLRSYYWYDMIYLLTAIGLTPGSSSTVHIYTKTVHRMTINFEECWPCHVFASYTLAFASQLRKKHGKTSVRVAEECQLARWKQNIQNRTYITVRIHKYIN